MSKPAATRGPVTGRCEKAAYKRYYPCHSRRSRLEGFVGPDSCEDEGSASIMSDRKYRQRGYQDDPRERQPRGHPAPPKERAPGRVLQDERGPKTPNLMAAHEVFRCARCGNLLSVPVGLLDTCGRCGVDLHSCIQCVSFDTSARWECAQSDKISARVSPKDARNACAAMTPRTTVERQTSTAPSSSGSTSGTADPSSSDARKAFDDLFK